MKIKNKIGGKGGRVGLGGQGGCEHKDWNFCENSKKKSAGGRGGQGGCERRIEVFVKIQKKNSGGGVSSGWGGGGLFGGSGWM